MTKLDNWIIGLLADYRAKRGRGYTLLEVMVATAVISRIKTVPVLSDASGFL